MIRLARAISFASESGNGLKLEKGEKMSSEIATPVKDQAAAEEVISVELPAPKGWKKKVQFDDFSF